MEFVDTCAMLGKFLFEVRRNFIGCYVLNSAIWNLLVSSHCHPLNPLTIMMYDDYFLELILKKFVHEEEIDEVV